MGGRNVTDRGAIVRHDRTLEIERRRKLARLSAQIGPHRCEGGSSDARTARQLGGRLLGVGAACIPIEREDDCREQRACKDEDEEGGSDHRCPEPAAAKPEDRW